MNVTQAKIFLIFILATTSIIAAEVSPELQVIDKRLQELREIWRQEQSIINGYTKNRTVPVREGSREYQACLEASKRIQQAEAEAKELKQKRKNIEDGSNSTSENKNWTSEGSPESIPYKTREFDVEAVKAKSISQKDKTLVFKGFYLGMPCDDALGLINHYMKLPQSTAEPIPPLKTNFLSRDGKGPFRIVKLPEVTIIAKADLDRGFFAVVDQEGKVSAFSVNPDIRNNLFDSTETPLDDFMQTFIDQYDIPELDMDQQTIEHAGEVIGNQVQYTHRSPKGFELKFFGKTAVLDRNQLIALSLLGLGNYNPEGSFSLKSIQTQAERTRKFD